MITSTTVEAGCLGSISAKRWHSFPSLSNFLDTNTKDLAKGILVVRGGIKRAYTISQVRDRSFMAPKRNVYYYMAFQNSLF